MAWNIRAVATLAAMLLAPVALAQDRVAQTNAVQAPAAATAPQELRMQLARGS